ncbi:hypothetical protein [Microbaculum marinum]|uniref:Uncharacterized protein n=1 Tax=Microbaculum marinum TaxID=1764581 RepID=A0AAW9RM97_9HYPH
MAQKPTERPNPAKNVNDAAVGDEEAAKQAARLRARIDQLAIGDRAVYDEDSQPDNK